MRKRRIYRPDGRMLKDMTCSVEGCGQLCNAGAWLEDLRPLCHMHATRWRRTGNPVGVRSRRGRASGPPDESMERRFLAALVIGDASEDGFTRHLLFTGHVDARGYGRLGTVKRPETPFGYVFAHRYAWEHWVGPLSSDLEIDHRPECPKTCVNPAHLQTLTKSEHLRLTWSRARRGEEAQGMLRSVKGVN